MRFRAALIDNDDTLMDFARGEQLAVQRVLALLHIDDPRAPERYRAINARYWRLFEEKLISQKALRICRFQALIDEYGVQTDPKQVAAIYEEALSEQNALLPSALEAVRTVSERMPVVILTNGIASIQRRRIASSPLADMLTDVLISSEIGRPKPAPDLFNEALRRLKLPANEALMIGDGLRSDIAGAIRTGIPACWYNPAKQPSDPDMHIPYIIDHIGQMVGILLSE